MNISRVSSDCGICHREFQKNDADLAGILSIDNGFHENCFYKYLKGHNQICKKVTLLRDIYMGNNRINLFKIFRVCAVALAVFSLIFIQQKHVNCSYSENKERCALKNRDRVYYICVAVLTMAAIIHLFLKNVTPPIHHRKAAIIV